MIDQLSLMTRIEGFELKINVAIAKGKHDAAIATFFSQ